MEKNVITVFCTDIIYYTLHIKASLLILTDGSVGKPSAEKLEGILRLSFYS